LIDELPVCKGQRLGREWLRIQSDPVEHRGTLVKLVVLESADNDDAAGNLIEFIGGKFCGSY
jgi:hypothetical protein